MARIPKHPYLLAWLCWFLFSCALVVCCIPKIRKAVEQSKVMELLLSRPEETSRSDEREITLFFFNPSMEGKWFTQWQRRLGGDLYHDTLEGLLSGPDKKNIGQGAASFINPNTRLIGCTLSYKVLFIDFSKDFLDSSDMPKAKEQVERTMLRNEAIVKTVILVEGKPLSEL